MNNNNSCFKIIEMLTLLTVTQNLENVIITILDILSKNLKLEC